MEKQAEFFDKLSLELPQTAVLEDGTVIRGETEFWDKYQDRRPQVSISEGEEQ